MMSVHCHAKFGAWMLLIALTPAWAEEKATIQLFNGKDLIGWYTHTTETGYENPGIFTVQDGILKISGGKDDIAYYGGMITEKEYADYRLVTEYKWGKPTYGKRKDRARDGGILHHCVGPDKPGPWITSIECQIIEGGTGDILVVNANTPRDKGVQPEAYATARKREKGFIFDPAAPSARFTGGRVDWLYRDPTWKDVVDFRGAKDVESPFGEWTRIECECHGDSLSIKVNGVLVNQVTGCVPAKGKILVQTEGAEMYFRKIELTPL